MRMLNRCLVCLIAASLALGASACALFDGEAPNLVDTRWRLVSYGEPGSETSVIEDTDVTLEFPEEDRAGGSGGCNTFGAEYEVSDSTLQFREIESTLILCIDADVMDQEVEYFEALRTAGAFELSEDALRIWYSDGEGVLNLVPAE